MNLQKLPRPIASRAASRSALIVTDLLMATVATSVNMASTSPTDVGPPAVAGDGEALPGESRTRLSGAWTAVVLGLITLVVILVFILQNPKSVEVSFLMFSGRLPLAVALLFAMILGAVIVFAFGAARLLQLRMVAGRARRDAAKTAS